MDRDALTRRVVTVPDIQPEIFQKLLEFMEGSPPHEDDNNNCCPVVLTSHTVAFEVRHAAKIYGVDDLVELCDRKLLAKLTFKNGLDFLVLATKNKAEDFKRKVFKVLRFRGFQVLLQVSPALAQELQLLDVLALVKLFDYVHPDLMLNFVQLWGANMNHDTFRELFRNHFYRNLRWADLSPNSMQQVHDAQLLDKDRETEALLRIMWAQRKGANEEEDAMQQRKSLYTKLAVRIKHRTFDFNKGFAANSLLIKVSTTLGPNYLTGWVSSDDDNYIGLDHGVYRSFQLMEKAPDARVRRGPILAVDEEDVQVAFSTWSTGQDGEKSDAKRQVALDVQIRGFYHPLEDSLVLAVSFRSVSLENFSSSSDRFSVEVRVARELLDDAREGNLQHLLPADASRPRSLARPRQLKAEVEAWESGCGEEKRFGGPKMQEEGRVKVKKESEDVGALAFVAVLGLR